MLTRRVLLGSVLGLGATALALGAMALSQTATDRPDCPGKIVCPLTGELVCKDRCPLGASAEKSARTTETATITEQKNCCGNCGGKKGEPK